MPCFYQTPGHFVVYTMSTSTYFSRYPAFPSDSTAPVRDIPTLPFNRVQAGSAEESPRLYQACTKEGFSFLDLNNSQLGETLLKNSGKMFNLIEKTFTLDQQALEDYACDAPRSLVG
jgi:hypothetical protein